MNLKLSNSQNLIIQGLLSILISALVAGLIAVGQEIAIHGLDFISLYTVFGGAFMVVFGTALKNFVPQHAKDEIQAGKDLNQQLMQALHIQTTTPPVVNVTVPPAPQAPQSQSPLQGLRMAQAQAQQQPVAQFVAPQRVSASMASGQMPQQAFPAPSVASVPVPPQPQTALAGTSPVSYPSATPAVQTLDITSTDTTPRVAALLSQMQNQQ